MQTVSAEFAAACRTTVRHPVFRVKVNWNDSYYVTETEFVVSHSGALRVGLPGEELVMAGDVGEATVILDNSTGRFSWRDVNCPLYPHIGGASGMFGKSIIIEQGLVVGQGDTGPIVQYVIIFTGIIFDWDESLAPRTVTLTCRDVGAKYLQHRISSVLLTDHRTDQLLTCYAALLGIPDGERVLDVSSFQIPYSWLDDESGLEEMWEVAQAEGGRCYFDGLGKLHFESVSHWVSHTTAVWELTGDDYQAYGPDFNPETLATKIIVEWSGRQLGAVTVLYNLEEVKVVRPCETVEFEARLNQPMYQLVPLESGTDYKFVSAGGIDLGDSVNITLPVANCYCQRCTVRITNNHSSLAAQVIFLQIRGYPLSGAPAEQTEATPTIPPVEFERVRTVRGNMYLQTLTQAQALARYLAARHAQIVPLWMLQEVPGIPHLELSDRVQFWALPTMTYAQAGYVTEIQWRCTVQDGFRQTLHLMDAAALYSYTDYFVVGQTALGAVGRCWY